MSLLVLPFESLFLCNLHYLTVPRASIFVGWDL